MFIKLKILNLKQMNTLVIITSFHLVLLLLLPLRTCHCDTSYYPSIPGNLTRSNSIDRRKPNEEGGGYGGGQSDEYTHVRGGCSSCVREEIKNRNIQVIMEEVLKKMGFERPPNFTGKVLPQVPPQVLAKIDVDSIEWQSDEPQYSAGHSTTEEDDEYHVKTEQIITFAQPYPRLRHWKGHDILHFSFTDSITKYHVANATLYVYVKGGDKKPLQSFVLEVFKVYKSESPGTIKVVSRKLTQPFGHGEWFRVDVTGMVSEWFKNPKENLGFIINGTVDGKKIVYTDKTPDGKRAPYVEISTKDVKRRLRRNSLNCDDRSNENICCRYPLTVNFEEFGWDFIIAPKKYDAHYCAGECSYLTMQKYPHTHLATIAAPNTATPCCAPRKLSPISMLYFDQQMNVVYGSLPGMVVDRCGCS